MTDPIDDYCRALRHELGTMPEAGDVVAEIEDHLRETTTMLVVAGTPDAEAARQAVDRCGRPGLVARSVRAIHQHPLDRDPAPVGRWVFGLAECLLLLAAIAAGAATQLHWQPCAGDAITPELIQDACLTQMDTSPAFPFIPEVAERSPAADGLRLAGLALMALAWTVVSILLPWRPRVRWAIALPVLPPLAMAADTLWLIADPTAQPQPWAEAASSMTELLAIPAFVVIVFLAAPLDHADRTGAGRRPPASTSYGTFRWRAALLLLGVAATSQLRAVLEYAMIGSISGLNWDTPPGMGYLAAGCIALSAIASLLIGRFAPPPVALDGPAGTSRPERTALTVPGSAR